MYVSFKSKECKCGLMRNKGVNFEVISKADVVDKSQYLLKVLCQTLTQLKVEEQKVFKCLEEKK